MIRVDNIHKTFKLYPSPADRLKEIILRKRYCQEFEALQGITFSVAAGETLGIIGENGAGKSTILKVLTGVLLPDSGTIRIDGKITGLLELGTGFNPEFTGLQNIYLNGTLLGMPKEMISNKLESIIDFTELGQFIHQPLKTYSSGMVMRLAFSIAIHADPQAFVVDEALSVGDAYFQQKCMNKIKAFKEKGGAIVFVSHDLNAVKVLCGRALLLQKGCITGEGDPNDVVNMYNFLLAQKSEKEGICKKQSPQQKQTYGNFKAEIFNVELMNSHNQESEIFVSGERCIVSIYLKANKDIKDIVVGVLIRDKFGQDIFGTNTYHLSFPIHLQGGTKCRLSYVIEELNLGPGRYTITVAAHKDATHLNECYFWTDAIKSFEVVSSTDFAFIGLSRLKPQLRIDSI